MRGNGSLSSKLPLRNPDMLHFAVPSKLSLRQSGKASFRSATLGVLRSLVFCLSTLFLFPSAHAQALPEAVTLALKNAGIPTNSIAIVVQSVNGTTPLLAHNAEQAMNPASVMKLLTTYAALDLLGPAYTWKTEALSEATPQNGQLNGNLFLRGGGDPKFFIEHFWTLLRQLRMRGIQDIRGDLILDRSLFSVTDIDPATFDGKPLRPYNIGPDALLVNFRSLRFKLTPENGRLQLQQETPSDGLLVENKLQLTDGACLSDWKDQITPKLMSEKSVLRFVFSGTYSRLCGERNLSLSPLDADTHIAGLFRSLWKELGGTFNGQVRSGLTPANAKIIAQHESPALADIVRDINKYSNNVMTRQLYLSLSGDDVPLTIEKSHLRLKQWLIERGLLFPELVIENGSGLSRHERISADSLNRLLLDAWKSPVMPELISSLPIAGFDGTMRKRLRASKISGRAHIKTGSLEDVKTAAGFVLNAEGQRYTVTVLINHPRASAGQAAIDALLLWVAQRP